MCGIDSSTQTKHTQTSYTADEGKNQIYWKTIIFYLNYSHDVQKRDEKKHRKIADFVTRKKNTRILFSNRRREEIRKNCHIQKNVLWNEVKFISKIQIRSVMELINRKLSEKRYQATKPLYILQSNYRENGSKWMHHSSQTPTKHTNTYSNSFRQSK